MDASPSLLTGPLPPRDELTHPPAQPPAHQPQLQPAFSPSLTHQSTVLNVTASIPYSEPFENALMHKALHDIIPPTYPNHDSTVQPVPLDSSLRTPAHALHKDLTIPLTHQEGNVYGGPGPLPISATSPEAYAQARAAAIQELIPGWKNIKGAGSLGKAVDRVLAEKVGEVRERMRTREEAVKKNEEQEKELRMLEDERKLERKLFEGMRKGSG